MPEINRQQMMDNLEEAVEAIRSAQQALAEFPDIDEDGLRGDLKVAYQYLGLSWNARHLSTDEYLDLCSHEERFQHYGNIPADFGLKVIN